MRIKPPNPDTLRSLRILERDANYDNVIKWIGEELQRITKEAIATKGDDQQRLCGAVEVITEILEYSNRADAILTARQKQK